MTFIGVVPNKCLDECFASCVEERNCEEDPFCMDMCRVICSRVCGDKHDVLWPSQALYQEAV